MKPSPVTIADPRTVALDPAPIRREWVLAGAPVAASAVIARSRDGTSVTIAWACTPGAFRWYFGVDETVHIIAGEVFIADDVGGPERRLGPGDVAFFPAGTWQAWRVTQPLRKLAVCRHAMPRVCGFALRAFNNLAALARGMPTGTLVAKPAAGEPALAMVTPAK